MSRLEIAEEELRKMLRVEEQLLTLAAYGTNDDDEDRLVVAKLLEVVSYIEQLRDIIKSIKSGGQNDS